MELVYFFVCCIKFARSSISKLKGNPRTTSWISHFSAACFGIILSLPFKGKFKNPQIKFLQHEEPNFSPLK